MSKVEVTLWDFTHLTKLLVASLECRNYYDIDTSAS